MLILSFFGKDRTKGEFPPLWFRALGRSSDHTGEMIMSINGFHEMDHHHLVTLAEKSDWFPVTDRTTGREGRGHLPKTDKQSEG